MERIEKLRQEAKLGGGLERIKKRHDIGRLTARERVELLLDDGALCCYAIPQIEAIQC